MASEPLALQSVELTNNFSAEKTLQSDLILCYDDSQVFHACNDSVAKHNNLFTKTILNLWKLEERF